MQKIPVAKIDLYLFTLINGCAKKSRVLDFLAIACATWLAPLLFFSLAAAALAMQNWQLLLTPLLAAAIARFVVAEIIYALYPRKRPPEVVEVKMLIKKPNHPSFPSGHSIAAFALSATLVAFNIPLAVVFLLASFLLGMARVFCGVHWPSDIIGGVVIGSLAGLTFCMYLV